MAQTPAAADRSAGSREAEVGSPQAPAAALPPRTGKALARRIDLSYHKRGHPLRALRGGLIILALVGTVAWWVGAMLLRGERIYSPGALAAAHAMFENDCSVCHDGGGSAAAAMTMPAGGHGAGFFKGVSDAACLRCHDAAVHSPRQVRLVALDGLTQAPAHSADCTQCHIEHRGRDVLAGQSDLLCTSCHADLKANVALGRTALDESITAFAPSKHPQFGRSLPTDTDGRFADPTALAFNHALHLEKYAGLADCARCHSTMDAWPAASPAQNAVLPPYTVAGKDRPPRWSASASRRDMLPISYERHCAGCHELTLPMSSGQLAPQLPGSPLHHEAMDLVRAEVSRRLEQAAAGPYSRRVETKGSGRFARPKVELQEIDRGQWLAGNAAYLMGLSRDNIGQWITGGASRGKAADEALRALSSTAGGGGDPSGGGDVSPAEAVEFYVAYAAANACALCHQVERRRPRPAEPAPATSPALPETDGLGLRTIATGIPSGPRRWFAGSIFDHQAHRAMSCHDCHGGVESSRASSALHLPRLESCVQCHHDGGTGAGSAGNSCIMCHVYHDRSGPGRPARAPALDGLLGIGRNRASIIGDARSGG